MTAAELIAEVRAGTLAPLYLLSGEESLQREIDEVAAIIRDAVLAGGVADFNQDRFRGKETDAAAFANALATAPMMSPRRLVLVREAHELPADAEEVVAAFAKDPTPTSVLLLLAEKADARSAIFKAASKAGRVLKIEVPYERDLPAWCRERARALGVTLEDGAARQLVEAVGRDLAGLRGALERLALFVGAGGRVGSEAVSAMVAETREHSVFALCDRVGAADLVGAWELARKILAQREPPLRLLALLSRHFRQLLRLREAREAGASRDAAGASAGISPYALKNLWPQVERHTLAGLRKAVDLLYDADLAIKSTRLPAETVLEKLVLDLVRVEKGVRSASRASR
jgi:DNA polymerase-3 subunit delta